MNHSLYFACCCSQGQVYIAMLWYKIKMKKERNANKKSKGKRESVELNVCVHECMYNT